MQAQIVKMKNKWFMNCSPLLLLKINKLRAAVLMICATPCLGFGQVNLSVPSLVEINRLILQGTDLTADSAEQLEKEVSSSPHAFSKRIVLLGYYFFYNYKLKPGSKDRDLRLKHIKWVVEHHPDSEVAGSEVVGVNPEIDQAAHDEVKKLWLAHVSARNTDLAILENAAKFFSLHEESITTDILKQAQRLDPNSHKWVEKLADHYLSLARRSSGEDSQRRIDQALYYAEESLRLNKSSERRVNTLLLAASVAFKARDIEKSRRYAEECISGVGNNPTALGYSRAIFEGNLLLGWIALKSGDIEAAKAYLLKAGKTPGNPALRSFGPSMILAKALLEKGERQAVIEYFHLCAKFWRSGKKNLEKWESEVKKRKMPDFGDNLRW